MIRGLALVALGAAAARAAPGVAPPRYPPPVVDPDAADEGRSEFWDAALEPGLGHQRELLTRARRLIESRDADALAEALELLADATQAMPGRADGFWYLGVAHEARGEWAACAAAFGQAQALEPDFVARPPMRREASLDHALGVCLARAGQLEAARVHLRRLTQGGQADADAWLRLGEVDMALGRLTDAQDDLGRAAEDAAISADVHWAMAVAFDRARKDADAERELETALRLDPTRTRAAAPGTPYLDDGELYYYQGLAAIAGDAPEQALVYFRQFAAIAPTSPWRARAEVHLAEVASTAWAERLEVRGTSAIEAKKAVAVLAAAWPSLTACVRATPRVLLQVRITTLGPGVGRGRDAPAPGTRATALVANGATDAELAAALTCVERVSSGLAFPRPTEAYGYVRLSFPVVAP
jgi:tetratricopeptide (TPR) repeat protein